MNRLNDTGTVTTCPVAIIIKNDQILLGLRNYTQDKWREVSVWTVPGGRCDAGETIEQTLRREVGEEIGIHDLEIIRYIGEVPGAKEGDRVLVYVCYTLSAPQLMEPEKFTEWKWFSMEDYCGGIPDQFINEDLRNLIVNDYNKQIV
jgi:8-oxo-dGTP diphosphatase